MLQALFDNNNKLCSFNRSHYRKKDLRLFIAIHFSSNIYRHCHKTSQIHLKNSSVKCSLFFFLIIYLLFYEERLREKEVLGLDSARERKQKFFLLFLLLFLTRIYIFMNGMNHENVILWKILLSINISSCLTSHRIIPFPLQDK